MFEPQEYVSTVKDRPPICTSQSVGILSLRQLMLSASCSPLCTYKYAYTQILCPFIFNTNSHIHCFCVLLFPLSVYKELSHSFFTITCYFIVSVHHKFFNQFLLMDLYNYKNAAINNLIQKSFLPCATLRIKSWE